jgi:site-specific recombinase XerD
MKRLPVVITPDDWQRLTAQPSRRAPTGKRNLAMLHTMYMAGLRVSEVAALSPRDMNSDAMTLRVRNGKGGKDRSNLGVPAETWATLERWARVRPESRFFFSTLKGSQLSPRYIHAMVVRYATRAGVMRATTEGDRPIHPHVLRHSYATRLCEAGVPIHDVQKALGHASLATTQVYLHVNDEKLADKLRDALSDYGEESEVERLVRRLIAEQLRAEAA